VFVIDQANQEQGEHRVVQDEGARQELARREEEGRAIEQEH
jgi:hypothetical protein